MRHENGRAGRQITQDQPGRIADSRAGSGIAEAEATDVDAVIDDRAGFRGSLLDLVNRVILRGKAQELDADILRRIDREHRAVLRAPPAKHRVEAVALDRVVAAADLDG